MKIDNFGKGAIKQEHPDPRNYSYENIVGAKEIVPFDWDIGFDVEDKVGRLKREHQDGSSSCVAQGAKKYQETLNRLEGVNDILSAKDIYSRIFQPQGGAYIQDGMKQLVKRGVNLELTNPSYENGKPPTEVFMRELLAFSDEEASIYGSKSYATLTHNSIDWIAQTIRDNNGVVSGFIGDDAGWKTADVKLPLEPAWGHCIFLKGACLRNGKKAIKFLNSWGEGWGEDGVGYFYEDYLGDVNYQPMMFDLFTLVDKVNLPNQKTMKYVVLKNEQFLLEETLKLALNIGDPSELEELKRKGLVGEPEKIEIMPEGYVEYPLVRKDRYVAELNSLKQIFAKLTDLIGL